MRLTSNLIASVAMALAALFVTNLSAQNYPGGPGGMPPAKNGRFYGKVVDEKGKGVGYATVQLSAMQPDPATKEMKEVLLAGQITEDNGDFSLENLPTKGEFTLKISFIGYTEIERKVSFDKTGSDKDLGNIPLVAAAQILETVTVKAEAATTTLALDRKIYRVDKDATTAGGNAQDALKNVPSLSVDVDGNVTLRNSSPQIFVDGRPTTLSLDQIAADAIESIEVITNPSAKYDAGGGQAGIVNIVLKKEKRIGYNGNVRAGTDTRGGYNAGGDINARGEKINLFASGNFNRMHGFSDAETRRQNLFGDPLTTITQTTDNEMNGFFANGRAGLDWFVDNRNTLTFSGNYTRGKFQPEDVISIRTDSLFQDHTAFTEAIRSSMNDRNFRNLGASAQFKHLFPKAGAEWTADLNFNRVKFMGGGEFDTQYLGSEFETHERQEGEGSGQFITFQSDFVNPITDKIKVEGGVRAALRSNTSGTDNSYFDAASGQWVTVSTLADHFAFDDNVYAAYGTFSQQFNKWGYQVGLRAESSFYSGELTDVDSSFSINYPISLFPSVFITRQLNELDNIQFSYTRRINRPNFFQTMPFTDFSDSLNLQRGNPDLLPEFTNSLELSYQNIFTKGHNLLVSLYYKQATDLITRYQFTEFNEDLGKEVVVASFANSDKSIAYGAEITVKNSFFNKLDLTTNFNIYNSKLDASNIESDLVTERVSWFVKENISLKLPLQFTLQLSGEYRSKASYTPSNGNQMPWMPGPTNTAQGYTIENWFVDAALRKDLFNNKASITLNVQDIFRTRRNGTYTSSDIFIQDTWRVRDPQVARLNFSYRFGKMDASLFKRKNMKMNSQGMDMMQ